MLAHSHGIPSVTTYYQCRMIPLCNLTFCVIHFLKNSFCTVCTAIFDKRIRHFLSDTDKMTKDDKYPWLNKEDKRQGMTDG